MQCSSSSHLIIKSGTCDYGNFINTSEKMTIKSSSSKKSTYRHIPHSEKPPHLVARRNARERKRVQAVNSAFQKLRKHVPFENKQKRLSKVKTLQFAIDYISNLQNMIEDHDRKMAGHYNHRMTLTEFQSNRQLDHGAKMGNVGYNWPDEESSNEHHVTGNNPQQCAVWPEYGTLGMNEITSLPNV
ncbi:ASCL [Mytilus coruscus]|uniref:ASCL n=1 Tax=Mytilus coruscus TaxID=42192 RepID=A0A6J8BVG9_MYTCO|nr:ASCL [Mytilus coruscus]